MKFRTAYDGLNEEVSENTGLYIDPSEECFVQQSGKDEADINNILKQFKVTGLVPQGVRMPEYGDFEGISDFRSAMDAINAAQASFMALPSDVRTRFGNDPQVFLEFCADENNFDELRKLGLAVPKAEPPKEIIQKVEVVNPLKDDE